MNEVAQRVYSAVFVFFLSFFFENLQYQELIYIYTWKTPISSLWANFRVLFFFSLYMQTNRWVKRNQCKRYVV